MCLQGYNGLGNRCSGSTSTSANMDFRLSYSGNMRRTAPDAISSANSHAGPLAMPRWLSTAARICSASLCEGCRQAGEQSEWIFSRIPRGGAHLDTRTLPSDVVLTGSVLRRDSEALMLRIENFILSPMRDRSDCRETVVMLTLFQWFELRGGGIAAQNCQKP